MKHTKYLVLALALGFCLASCHKFLDQNPNSSATDQTTWQSEGDANSSVAACYSLIRSAFNTTITYYSYGDLPSDEFSDVVAGDVTSYSAIRTMTWNVSVPAANTYDPKLKMRLYTNFYSAVSQSNRCLYFINNMPLSAFTGSDTETKQARKNKYLAEAYFTRAFNYFYMARVWGDVPLITDYIADVSTAPQLPRTPQAVVLAQAISDANWAKQNLDWKDASSPDAAVRADKGAAFALLAHIYAWKGSYDSCAMMCDSVLNSGSYTLTDSTNYMSVYKGQSSESIFEIAGNSSTESQAATDPFLSITGATLTPPYLNNSATQPAWQIDGGLVNYLFQDTADVRYQKAFAKLSNNGATIFECIKYANIQNVNNNPAYQIAVNNIIVFRLADIELLKAEALAAKSAPDPAGALVLVNDVRSHRGSFTPISGVTGNDLLYLIADERGRELFLEGQRFYDLIRLERLTGEQQNGNMTHAEFLAGKYYWPVDPTLFLTDASLTQTPFWVGKIR